MMWWEALVEIHVGLWKQASKAIQRIGKHMARGALTREDMAEFDEISGYFKARGETLTALRKVRAGKFQIALSNGENFYGHLIRGEGHNINDIRRTET